MSEHLYFLFTVLLVAACTAMFYGLQCATQQKPHSSKKAGLKIKNHRR